MTRSGKRLGLAGLVAMIMFGAAPALPAGAASPPTLHITKGPYRDGQLINVSVGPNHFYTAFTHINILECSDPGGIRQHLPTNVDTCDGNTIQPDTILVAKNGSWSIVGFQIFALPNIKSLGEEKNGQPVCNARKACVLYIGENQERFTWPKQFSPSFTIRPAKRATT
jgi:hypothetical protein